jgi:hypothetical protein
VRTQSPTRLGEPHGAGGALEQGQAELPFQPSNLLADRRLHDVQPRRGPAEVQLLGHGEEVLKLTEFHAFAH